MKILKESFVKTESLDVFKVELPKQKIPVLSNYWRPTPLDFLNKSFLFARWVKSQQCNIVYIYYLLFPNITTPEHCKIYCMININSDKTI